jgi:hypothetical protein
MNLLLNETLHVTINLLLNNNVKARLPTPRAVAVIKHLVHVRHTQLFPVCKQLIKTRCAINTKSVITPRARNGRSARSHIVSRETIPAIARVGEGRGRPARVKTTGR